MGEEQPSDDVSIGKFDILATYAYAGAILDERDVGGQAAGHGRRHHGGQGTPRAHGQ
jgi:hypothetical protein